MSSQTRSRTAALLLAATLVAGTIVAASLLAGPGHALAAEPVKTRAWEHDGFGRIVFDWGAPVGHRVRVEDGRLVVRFDRPMGAALDAVPQRLASYVSAARLEDGGRKAVFTLTRAVSARDASDGNLVVIDLVAAGEAHPPARADGAAGGERLAVRAGEHGDFTRLVFDWREPVEYKATQSGDTIRIAFDHPANADLADVKADLPPFVKDIEQIPSPHGLLVVLKVAEGARLRHFRSETKVVADVLGPASGEAQSAELTPADGPVVPPAPPARQDRDRDGGAQSDKAPEKAPGVSPENPGGQPQAVPPSHQMPAPGAPRRHRTAVAATEAPAATTAPPSAQALAPPTRLYPPPARAQSAPAGNAAARAAQPARSQPTPGAQSPQDSTDLRPAGGPAVSPPAMTAPVPPAPVSLLSPTTKTKSQAPAAKPAAATTEIAKAATPGPESATQPSGALPAPSPRTPALKVAASAEADGIALRFPWSQPTAAAAFARAGSLWIVFDREATLDLSGLGAGGGHPIAAAEQVAADGATAVRLKIDAGLNPELRQDGEAWVVNLKHEEPRPQTPVAVSTTASGAKSARFVVPLEGPGHKVVLKDPEVGDTVTVVPVRTAGQGIPSRRDYPLFRLLATAQGVAVESKADDLEIDATKDGLEITAPNGLFLSAGASASSPAGAAGQTNGAETTPQSQPNGSETRAAVSGGAGRSLFDFAAWRHDGASFEDTRQMLLQAAADAPEASRNEARMRLAQFYFAHGFAAETLGVLRIVSDSEPRYMADPLFRAMRGVSRYLMADYAGAAEDLSVPGLAGSADAALWRGAVAVAQARWPDATAAFATVGDRIPGYPPKMRTRLAEDAAETALNAGEFDAMKIYLDMADKGAPDAAARARAKYLLGRAAEKQGDRDKAAALYDQAAAIGDTQIAVRATYAKVGMLLDDGKMTRPDAIKALEGLRYSWRGDGFEYDLLRRLGNLYLAESQYERGLSTLRRAVTLFPTMDGAEAVTKTMTDAFEKLYLAGAADKLSPLKALGLYQDFRELTPPGEKGDEMIRKLAERLVAVDLLDQAGDLLENQVDYRLQGETKARVGARLAGIRLLDKMPDKALSAIDSSEVGGLPDDLVAERRHLKARALAELGRSDDAFAALKGDESPQAETIRADILWNSRDWAGAAKVLTRLAAAIAPNAALTDDQSVTVLRLSVALWLANDQQNLEALRQRFAARMDSTPYRDDFRVIAAAPTDDVESVQSIAQRLAEVDQYEAFLAGLKERAKKPQVASAAK